MDGEMWKDCEVEASSVADFLMRYYKPDRYTERGEEYAATLLASYEKDVAERGYAIISHHDSITGRYAAYFRRM